jgi:ATP-dependent protease Clp ATPase subunit
MFDVPDHGEIRKCIITEETIRTARPPLLLTKSQVEEGVDETNYIEFLSERGQSA